MSVKTSQIPNGTPATTDKVVGVKNPGGSPSTNDFTLSDLITLAWTLANIPSGATSPITRDNESQFAFVASGLVWSGDSYGSNRNASMTAGVCYINGRRISINAVTARTFTASKDTYIDILDNGDGTGTLVYTEATNNAASPSLAANSIRIGIIVTGATTIANSGSVNQGQVSAVLPIASSIAYSVTDSLGNLICSRDPSHKLLGFRQATSNTNSSGTGATQVTGLTCPVIIPTGRNVKVSLQLPQTQHTSGAICTVQGTIWDGTAGSGTQIGGQQESHDSANILYNHFSPDIVVTPAAGSKTYNGAIQVDSGTETAVCSSTKPASIKVELE